MNNRRKFLAAGGALAALSALPQARADEPRGFTVYLHGMVWNRQLLAPLNDWLVRLDAKADVPIGDDVVAVVPGFATLGDDFHDPVNSHVTFQKSTLRGDQLTIIGVITESKTPSLVGQAVRIAGILAGTSVQGLTVTIGAAVLSGAGITGIMFEPFKVLKNIDR